MTQIKLRRDTAANFTSKNPVLGVGEPAYETDTKKLKIGDGTTAYTQLDYFSAGGSANISATLPLKIVDGVISLEVDGQTIQIVDGKLHANLDELNNPFSLFDSKYSDHELNNLSWLKSEGQWNAKAVYTDAYGKLLKVHNGTETVEGLSVKLSTETYTDYDFVLNTADETFRLPLKNHTADDGKSVLTLYYYVGETVQNANLIDAGRIGEQLANKIGRTECKAYITETYVNGTSGYRIWSDGYCEQWGFLNGDNVTVTLLKKYKDTNYEIYCQWWGGKSANFYASDQYINNITSGGFHTNGISQSNVKQRTWRTCGYLAQGEN